MKARGTRGVARPPGHDHDSARVHRRVVEIGNAALRTLNATAVEVIPAPGVGLYLDPFSFAVRLLYTAPAFDGVGANDSLVLRFTNAAGAMISTPVVSTGFGDAASDQVRCGLVGIASGAGGPVAYTPVENSPIVAHILTGEWYVAAGGSSLIFEILYRVRPYLWRRE